MHKYLDADATVGWYFAWQPVGDMYLQVAAVGFISRSPFWLCRSSGTGGRAGSRRVEPGVELGPPHLPCSWENKAVKSNSEPGYLGTWCEIAAAQSIQ